MKFIFAIIFILVGATSHAAAEIESADVQTVESVDLQKYVGRWYEVASIPQFFQRKCIGNTSAEYSFAEDNLIRVSNSCDTETGERITKEGRARVVDAKSNSKLQVTFVKIISWIFAFGGDYWILDLDENYSLAVIGNPTRKYAWILSRSPQIPFDQLVRAEKSLKNQGYDTCQVLTSIQTGGFSERKPLCKAVLEK